MHAFMPGLTRKMHLYRATYLETAGFGSDIRGILMSAHQLHNCALAGTEMARSKWLANTGQSLACCHSIPGAVASVPWFRVLGPVSCNGSHGCVLGCHGRVREAREKYSSSFVHTRLKPAWRRGRTEASSWSSDLQQSRKCGHSADTNQDSSH